MIKTASFAAVHFTVAFSVGYVMTGSVWVGGAIALVEPALNTVAYFFHERVWERIRRRREAARVPAGRPVRAASPAAPAAGRQLVAVSRQLPAAS